MKVFISYAAEDEELAERISLALRSDGHSTFFDRASLRAGHTFDNRIRTAIEECDLILYLMRPGSVEPGSYARAELAIAQAKWQQPDGHVVPVMVAPTQIETLPPYLRSVSILKPQGDVVAEASAAVFALSKPEWNLPFEERAVAAVLQSQMKAEKFALKFLLIVMAVFSVLLLLANAISK